MKVNYDYSFVSPKEQEKVRKESSLVVEVDKNLKVNKFDNAYVLPLIWAGTRGGVSTENGELIKSTSTQHIVDLYDYDKDKVVRNHKRAIYIGSFSNYVWGHCFTEHFGKLWFLDTPECAQLRSEGVELVYAAQYEEKQYFKELMRLAGLNISDARRITMVEQFDELYLPDDSFFSTEMCEPRYFTTVYRTTIKKVKENVFKEMQGGSFITYDKIYLTRTQGTFSRLMRDFGERKIEKVFEKCGYKVIAPEKLTVQQQIWLMMHVDYLATTEGSIAHTAVFCKEGTHIALLRKADWVSMHQVAVNECARLEVTYIDAHHSTYNPKDKPWAGPFYLYLSPYLKHFLRIKEFSLPPYLQFDYWIYCLREVYMRTLRQNKMVDSMVRKLIK